MGDDCVVKKAAALGDEDGSGCDDSLRLAAAVCSIPSPWRLRSFDSSDFLRSGAAAAFFSTILHQARVLQRLLFIPRSRDEDGLDGPLDQAGRLKTRAKAVKLRGESPAAALCGGFFSLSRCWCVRLKEGIGLQH